MQQKPTRRSNKDRTDFTRAALIRAARELFVENGYAETGTPAIVAAANVTRGALYHHFADKADLFRAVLVQEAQAVAALINAETGTTQEPFDALLEGTDAYFDAMATRGRAKLLLVEGPAALGHQEMQTIDEANGGATLRAGLAAAISPDALDSVSLDALSELLSAAFDRAALAVADGRPASPYKDAIGFMLKGMLESTESDAYP